MKYALWATVAVLALTGCNSETSEVEELQDRIEQLERQRADGTGDPAAAVPTPGASATPLVGGRAAGGPTPTASSTPTAGGDVCTDGVDRHLVLRNESGQTMMYFYASPPTTEDWEEDILGSDVLENGQRFSINFNSDSRCTCVYDTKAEFADGSEDVREANVCTQHEVVYR